MNRTSKAQEHRPNRSPGGYILLLVLLGCWPLLNACIRSQPITATQVEDFLKELDAAAAKKDPSVLIKHLAKDAIITVKMNNPWGPENRRYTVKEYREMVADQMAALKDFKYQRLETKVEISTDKKVARVTIKQQELLTLKNMVLSVQSQQVSIYTHKGGQIVVKSVDSEGTLKRVR